jgi:hypothetical protein
MTIKARYNHTTSESILAFHQSKNSTFVLSYEPKKKYIKHKIIMSLDNHYNITKYRIKLMKVGRRKKSCEMCPHKLSLPIFE